MIQYVSLSLHRLHAGIALKLLNLSLSSQIVLKQLLNLTNQYVV